MPVFRVLHTVCCLTNSLYAILRSPLTPHHRWLGVKTDVWVWAVIKCVSPCGELDYGSFATLLGIYICNIYPGIALGVKSFFLSLSLSLSWFPVLCTCVSLILCSTIHSCMSWSLWASVWRKSLIGASIYRCLGMNNSDSIDSLPLLVCLC